MIKPEEILQQRVSDVLSITSRIPNGIIGLTAARDADLIELVTVTQKSVIALQGVLAATSGEISRRSTGSGDASLARRLGYRSARTLLAGRTGMGLGEASRTIEVGEAIRPRVSLSGEDFPAERAHIAGAVLAGVLPLSIAQLIDQTVEKVADRLILDQAQALEKVLVEDYLSGRFTPAGFLRYCNEVVDHLDATRIPGRDQDLRNRSTITETWLQNGMLRITALLDPETAAFYKAAMRAKTNPRRPSTTDSDEHGGGGETGGGDDSNGGADARTAGGGDSSNDPEGEGVSPTDLGTRRDPTRPDPMRTKLHAFIRIMRDSLKHENGPQAGVDTTILVRIDLDTLLSGIGSATIDGVPKPIPASAVRRLAAEADLIPQVLDGRSQLLDQGASKRVFTKAQRYAILSAFTGCAFPGCDIPSSMLEYHHIDPWAKRHQHEHATDLDNGLPLCGFHNRLMETGWGIEFDDDHVPWFTPPAHLDFFRKPLRAGNLARRAA